jgi:hypothetical protein
MTTKHPRVENPEVEKEMKLAQFRIEIKAVLDGLEKKTPGKYELIVSNIHEIGEKKMNLWNHFKEVLRKMESPQLFDREEEIVKLNFAMLHDEITHLENEIESQRINGNGSGGRKDSTMTETPKSQFISFFTGYLTAIKSAIYEFENKHMSKEEYLEEVKLIKNDFGI